MVKLNFNWGKLKNILEILKLSTDYLNNKGIESPRLNTELIISKVTGISRIGLYTHFDKPLNTKEIDKIREMISRRAKFEPLQYIIGDTQFLDLNINVNSNVLIPRPETESLIEKVIETEKDSNKKLKILDIGTGSGCIAIALAKYYKNSEVIAADISESAIKTAKENAENAGINNIQFFQFDILQKKPKSKFDIIVSNPPYISENDYNKLEKELFYEPKNALSDGGDGFAFYRRYAEIFESILNENAKFFLEIGFGQYEKIYEIFSVTKLQISVSKDLNGVERIVCGGRKN